MESGKKYVMFVDGASPIRISNIIQIQASLRALFHMPVRSFLDIWKL